MMLFRREAYLAIGGHGSVSSSIVDDLGLTRRIIAAGLRWRVAHVADLISCRMYLSSAEAISGFSKNLFAAFEARVIPYALAFAWLMVMFWVPLVVLVLRFVGLAPQAQAGALGICVGLSVLVWSVPYVNLGLPVGLALLYPLTVLANVVVAAQSLVRSLHGQLTWKGRQVLRPKWKWL
jgi:chlorobactene glucosyltransferase